VPTQQERHAETRRRLLSAARAVFAEKGYENASVAEVVRRAGRAQGSFYLHFANKEAVLQALLNDAMAHSKALWRRDKPGSSVRTTVHEFIDEFGDNKDLWLLLDQRSSLEPSFKAMSDQWFQQLADSILDGMASVENFGLMPGLDPVVLSQVLAAMLFDSTRAAYQETRDWTTDELAEEITRIWSLTLGYSIDAGDQPTEAR
jgi:AcrR family transcriptional regulator